MARLTRWVQKLLRRAGKDGHEQTMIQPRCPAPRAIHHRHWQQDTLKSLKRDRSSSSNILLVLLGAPGAGKRSVGNKLLYDDMNGGYWLEYSLFCMEDEQARYFCGGYVYDLDLLMDASQPVASIYGGGVHNFYSMVLAYDVYSQASFDEVSLLYDSISAHRESGRPGVAILILGLKADMDSADGRVPRETGEAFAAERGCSFAECSAKTGDGVLEAFGGIVEYTHSIMMQFSGDPEGLKSFVNENRTQVARALYPPRTQ